MKNIKLTVFVLVLVLTNACNQVTIPNNIIEDDNGYEKLVNYIYSHYPELEDNIEVMEFSYNSSIHPQRDEISSRMSMNFVKGSNKNRIVEYTVNNEGKLDNSNVDISIGDSMNKESSNSYETFEPYLFSSKNIDLDVLRKIISQSIEELKKEKNIEKAYCSSVRIEKEAGEEPTISVTTKERKFSTRISKFTDWTLQGERLK